MCVSDIKNLLKYFFFNLKHSYRYINCSIKKREKVKAHKNTSSSVSRFSPS